MSFEGKQHPCGGVFGVEVNYIFENSVFSIAFTWCTAFALFIYWAMVVAAEWSQALKMIFFVTDVEIGAHNGTRAIWQRD